MTGTRILIVEDDREIAEFLAIGLSAEGYDVIVEPQGAGMIERVRAGDVRLVILDRMLPDAEGVDLCRRLRSAGNDILVLMLTARDALEEKLEGLRAGVDDYVTKPFAFEELLARIQILLRRASPTAEPARTLAYADLSVDLERKVAYRGGRELTLTATEFNLLRFFLENAGRVVSRMEILNAVWGYDFDPHTNIVEVYIAYLRRKMDREAGPRLLRNVRGFGYMLSAEEPPPNRRA